MWIAFSFTPFQVESGIVMSRIHKTAAAIAQLVLLLQSVVLPVFSSAGNIVDTGYAKYRGNLSFPNTVAYLGIPYAEPPLGELRFRETLPLNTTRASAAAGGKIIDVTEYPDFCIQGSTGGKIFSVDTAYFFKNLGQSRW
jgi:hypothetical protein